MLRTIAHIHSTLHTLTLDGLAHTPPRLLRRIPARKLAPSEMEKIIHRLLRARDVLPHQLHRRFLEDEVDFFQCACE